jgi:phosphonate transport system substrate-binding protein
VYRILPSSVTTAAPTTAAPVTAAGATTAAPKSQKWPDKLIFAPVPAENATAANLSWAPFVRGLERELGVKIEQVNLLDYSAVIEAQISGKVDIAMYGPFAYYLAKQAGAKIDPLAIMVNNIGAPATYVSYLVARPDGPVKSIADVKGRKVCFVDTASTSGYLYPVEGLLAAGIDPNKDITPVYAGGHDRSPLAVKAGTCDAGFVFDDMFDKLLIERGQLRKDELSVVWRSKPIPNSPMAVRTDLPDTLVTKLKDVVPKIDTLYIQANKLCNGGGSNCTLSGSVNAWVVANDSFFNAIADVCKATKAAACSPPKR